MAISIDEAQALARPDSVKKPTAAGKTAQDLGDRFLKLLVTQMRNQDPLNPLQNAEVTSQLAQISTVTGVDKLNASLEAMSKAMAGAQTLQASTLVGHSVLAPGNVLDHMGAGAVGAIDLKEPADFVNIDIFNADKLVVAHLSKENVPAGVSSFTWEGTNDLQEKLKNDAYTFQVKAHRDGKPVESAMLSRTLVNSVTLGGNELELNTKTLGSLVMSQVRQIF